MNQGGIVCQMIPYLKLVVGVERFGLGANKDDVCLGSYMFDTGWIFRVCPGIRFICERD